MLGCLVFRPQLRVTELGSSLPHAICICITHGISTPQHMNVLYTYVHSFFPPHSLLVTVTLFIYEVNNGSCGVAVP